MLSINLPATGFFDASLPVGCRFVLSNTRLNGSEFQHPHTSRGMATIWKLEVTTIAIPAIIFLKCYENTF